jgi:hypothetical protein
MTRLETRTKECNFQASHGPFMKHHGAAKANLSLWQDRGFSPVIPTPVVWQLQLKVFTCGDSVRDTRRSQRGASSVEHGAIRD